MKKAFVVLADGFEDIEAITPIDILRRAGISVEVIGLAGKSVISSHGIQVTCDHEFSDRDNAELPDLVVLPGGGQGSKNLAASEGLKRFVSRMFHERRLVGAICAAPAVVLGGWGLLEGRKYTCYPGTEDGLSIKPLPARVVEDGNLITAGAAGIAEEFSLALVRRLCGAETERKIASGILARLP